MCVIHVKLTKVFSYNSLTPENFWSTYEFITLNKKKWNASDTLRIKIKYLTHFSKYVFIPTH